MPIDSWNYCGAPAQERHVGPVAEDFHAAFGLGRSESAISHRTDMAGAALASVKALQQEIKQRDEHIQDLEQRRGAGSADVRCAEHNHDWISGYEFFPARHCPGGHAGCGNVGRALALAPTAHGNNLYVIDVATRNSTVLRATACCAVQAGSVAADVANDRVFFLSNRSDGMDLYFRLRCVGAGRLDRD